MLPPTASLIVVAVALASTLVPTAIAFWLAAHHLGVLLLLRGAARQSRLDRPGSVVLSGRVVADRGDAEPISILIEQERVASARSPLVLWREIARTPTLRPFEIALANGARVRVEPDADTRVADHLSLESEPDWGPLAAGARARGDRRLKRAAIRDGDTIQLVGALRASTRQRPKSSAFRGAVATRGGDDTPPPRALVVRRHPLEPLLLSKQKLSSERAPRVVLHASALALFLAIGIGVHLGALLPYYRLALWGKPTWATVVATTEPDGKTTALPRAGHSLRVELETYAGREIIQTEPIDATLAAQVHEAAMRNRPLKVALLVSGRSDRVIGLGTAPRAPSLALLLSALASLLGAAYFLAARRARPWFERDRLDERESVLESALLSKSPG